MKYGPQTPEIERLSARVAELEQLIEGESGNVKHPHDRLNVRDRVTEEQFNTLYGPWASVMED